MVDGQLRPQGVTGPAVLAAMASVPRERFVPPQAAALAYADCSVPLGDGRAICAPAVTGRLLDALDPKRGERALVVGTGAGYGAALLADIGLEVTALDSRSAAKVAVVAGVTAVTGPLQKGWARGAPYDLILIDGAVEEIPQALIGQLGEGGRIGAALRDRGVGRLVVGRRSAGSLGMRSIGDADVPLLPGFARPPAFAF